MQKFQEGLSFKTANSEKIAHLGNSVMNVVTENGLNRRITCAVAGVKKSLLPVSKSNKTGHTVEFSATGGFITNAADGSRIPMYVKNGAYNNELWVRSDTMSSGDF